MLPSYVSYLVIACSFDYFFIEFCYTFECGLNDTLAAMYAVYQEFDIYFGGGLENLDHFWEVLTFSSGHFWSLFDNF